jgi:hypothetical protein
MIKMDLETNRANKKLKKEKNRVTNSMSRINNKNQRSQQEIKFQCGNSNKK